VPHDPGPEQTATWPLVWADLDPNNLPSWVVWKRLCALRGSDEERDARVHVRYSHSQVVPTDLIMPMNGRVTILRARVVPAPV